MVRAANARRAGLSLDAWRLPGPDAASPLSAARSLLCAPLRAARRARSAARQLFRQGPPIRQGGTVSAFGAPSRKGVVAGATSCGSHTSGAGTACWATATRRALGIPHRALLHTRKGAVVSRYPYLLFFYSDTL